MRHGDVAPMDDSPPADLAFDLDAERLGPLERQDEGGRLGERRQERPAERDHLVPNPDHVAVRQETELLERKDRLHEVRLEDVLEVHAADRLAEVLRQGLHLLMGDEVRPLQPDGRREPVFFGLAEGRAVLESPVKPHGRRGQHIREEHLAGVERERGVARQRRDAAGADPDRVDRVQPLGRTPRHGVRDARVQAHRDEPGQAGRSERIPHRELFEDPGEASRLARTCGGWVEIVRTDLEGRLHDPEVVLRERRVDHEIRACDRLREGDPVLHVQLFRLDRDAPADAREHACSLAELVDEQERGHARISPEFGGQRPAESPHAEDRDAHRSDGGILRGFSLFAVLPSSESKKNRESQTRACEGFKFIFHEGCTPSEPQRSHEAEQKNKPAPVVFGTI